MLKSSYLKSILLIQLTKNKSSFNPNEHSNTFLTTKLYIIIEKGRRTSMVVIQIPCMHVLHGLTFSEACADKRGLNTLPNKPWCLQYKSFENTVGKGGFIL